MIEPNLVNMLNPWLETWYCDNSIEKKNVNKQSILISKNTIKKIKFLQVLLQIKCKGWNQ
jgi:hypothetical protein